MLTAQLLIGLALKSLVLAGLTLGVLGLARSRTPAERSLIAHLGLFAILLLPAASILLPQWAPLPQGLFAPSEFAPATPTKPMTVPLANPPASALEATATAPSFNPPTLAELAVWIYALPLVLMFVTMAVAVLRLFGMRRRADVLIDAAWLSALAEAQRRMGFKHGTALLVSEELRSPISWGVLRPTILLDPRAVSAVRDAEAIIAHELAHVARLDWAKLLVARLASALFWFNPLVWLLARESHHLREEAADDTVLLTDIAGSDYATLLVNAARHDNRAVLIAAHGVAPAKNSLRRRVVRALDVDVRRGPVRIGWALFSLTSVFAVAAPLAAFSTVTTSDAASLASFRGDASGSEKRSSAAAPEAAIAGETVGNTSDVRTPLSAADLVSMRAVGTTPADVAQMRDGREEFDADEVISAKATGVTSGYIAEMRRIFPHAEVAELVGARAVGVDPAYARAMRSANTRADLDTIIDARAVGITAAYAREIHAHFPKATLDDLVSMRATGVTGKYVEDMRASGVDIGSPDDAVGIRAVMNHRARQSGVPREPGEVAAAQARATAIIRPGGIVSTHRTENGTSTAVILSGPRSPRGQDEN